VPSQPSSVSRSAPSTTPTPPVALRLIEPSDAECLAGLLTADREILARWEPAREDHFFNADGQVAVIEKLLGQHATGRCLPWVITVADEPVGRVTVRDLTGRPFHKAIIGYWVANAFASRGYATAAVALAIHDLGRRGDLHRVEATTQVANEASHRVLRRNGFSLMGLAREHIFTAGRWHDELLWELVLDTDSSDQEAR